MAVPVGYKFKPSDEQLLGFFLRKRVINGPSTNPPMIYECDLYGEEEPWQVWAKYRPIYEKLFQGGAVDEDSDLYFFTKLKKKDPSHKRVMRTVGLGEEGTWHGCNVGKKIRAQGSGVLIGITKMFTYKKSKSKQSGNWIMHEYTLNDHDSDNVVLCRLRRKHLIHVGPDHNLVELNNQATDQFLELGPLDTEDPGVVHGGEIDGAVVALPPYEVGTDTAWIRDCTWTDLLHMSRGQN